MKSKSLSKQSVTRKTITAEESREWEELADAVVENEGEPAAPERAGLVPSESPVDEKEQARLAKERRESRSHEDLVKAGVEKAADDQEESHAMRHPL